MVSESQNRSALLSLKIPAGKNTSSPPLGPLSSSASFRVEGGALCFPLHRRLMQQGRRLCARKLNSADFASSCQIPCFCSEAQTETWVEDSVVPARTLQNSKLWQWLIRKLETLAGLDEGLSLCSPSTFFTRQSISTAPSKYS